MSAVLTFARLQFSRHLRSPALWLVALAAPVAAKFMVPAQEDNYTVVAINDAFPVLTPGVIGMELGIITALLMSPLAYIFLRSGPARRRPWQAEDVTPQSRVPQFFGYWLADTAVLWCVMMGLGVAGIILSYFRLPIDQVRPLETLTALVLIAGPALAFVAALRLAFSARPKLGGGLGDVLFFLLWISGVTMGAVFFMSPSRSMFADLFGYAASISGSVSEPIETFVVGSSPGVSGVIEVDAMRGILAPAFIISRIFWLVMAVLLACIGGALYKGRIPKQKRRADRIAAGKISDISRSLLNFLVPKSGARAAPLWTNITQIISPYWLIMVLLAAAIAGAVFPFRGGAGAAIWLILIFPLTAHSARWRSRNLSQFSETLAVPRSAQFWWSICAAILIASLVCLPALLRALVFKSGELGDIIFVSAGVPLFIMIVGYITRSGFAARLLMLMLWYGYLNM